MKKTLAVLTIFALLVSAGCANQKSEINAADSETFVPVAASATPETAQGPDIKPEAANPQGTDRPSESGGPSEPNNPSEHDNQDIIADVDLTVLSSTMVYAEVYNMMMEPESYVGKVIKLQGLYYSGYYEPTSQYYHFVIISDATACCAQGLEFVWLGEHAYPEDYPEGDTEIGVIGIFESYEEEGNTYYRIITEKVEVL